MGFDPAPEPAPPPPPPASAAPAENWFVGALKWVGGVVLVLIVIGVIRGVTGAGSVCNVVAMENLEEAFIVNGELDYGIVTNATVELEGRGREVTVTVRLETNEGDFTRSQRINVGENGRRTVQIQFPEPTIGSTVDQSVGSCS